MAVSSPEFDPTERAALLSRKAEEDALAVREFAANPDVGDGIIGFHAQQAVEKWLKAVIASRGETYEHTHDLDRLVEVVTAEGRVLPLEVDELIALTEYAVPLRYEDLLDTELLDRGATVSLVEEVSRWASVEIESGGAGPHESQR
jgi:HEPN domain-containing protein